MSVAQMAKMLANAHNENVERILRTALHNGVKRVRIPDPYSGLTIEYDLVEYRERVQSEMSPNFARLPGDAQGGR